MYVHVWVNNVEPELTHNRHTKQSLLSRKEGLTTKSESVSTVQFISGWKQLETEFHLYWTYIDFFS